MPVKIRKAIASDIDTINEIYEHIHTEEEKGAVSTGWVRGVYPTRATAEEALARKDLFVEEIDGNVVGTAIINHLQADVYKEAAWQYDFPNEQIMVLHTLVIDPYAKGNGFGKAFVEYYEQYAIKQGCKCLRMDTNELNANARGFYKKLNYSEVDILPCLFNGIPDVKLVMLEKKLN
ncbi:MAG: GNAT family N-acetyltransferase [Clostridia bacterium]|nr:GNAT family N-acetyltransferase [Clostridia bacterium]